MYVCVRERISRSVFEESGRLRLPCKEPLRLLPLISPTHTLSFRDIHHAHIKDTRTHSRIICHSDLLSSSVTCSDLPCSPSLITEAVLFLGYRFTLASQDSPAILLSPTSLPPSSAPSRAFVSVSQHNQTAQTTKHNWAVKICFFRTYVCGTPFNFITQTGLRNLFFPVVLLWTIRGVLQIKKETCALSASYSHFCLWQAKQRDLLWQITPTDLVFKNTCSLETFHVLLDIAF